jgi:hypothetical protein
MAMSKLSPSNHVGKFGLLVCSAVSLEVAYPFPEPLMSVDLEVARKSREPSGFGQKTVGG